MTFNLNTYFIDCLDIDGINGQCRGKVGCCPDGYNCHVDCLESGCDPDTTPTITICPNSGGCVVQCVVILHVLKRKYVVNNLNIYK